MTGGPENSRIALQALLDRIRDFIFSPVLGQVHPGSLISCDQNPDDFRGKGNVAFLHRKQQQIDRQDDIPDAPS